jgi:HAD superfamily hydrolase (TIGR01484 family)
MTDIAEQLSPHLTASRQSHVGVELPRLIASDLDNTLIKGLDPASQHHQNLVQAAQGQHLAILTARRAANPGITVLWQSGLVAPERPIITENGGVLTWADGDKIDLVERSAMDGLMSVSAIIAGGRGFELPRNSRLVRKFGRTMMVLFIEDQNGKRSAQWQHDLAEQLSSWVPMGTGLQVADGTDSVTIQHQSVNKAQGLLAYCAVMGLDPDQVDITAMGDGLNDVEMLQMGDFGIGFSQLVASHVDVLVPDGAAGAPAVLQAIKEGAKR